MILIRRLSLFICYRTVDVLTLHDSDLLLDFITECVYMDIMNNLFMRLNPVMIIFGIFKILSWYSN